MPLHPISKATARAHYDAGKTIHAVSPQHKAAHHMAHAVKQSATNPQSFASAAGGAADVMQSQTGSPAVGWHSDDPAAATPATPEDEPTGSPETPA